MNLGAYLLMMNVILRFTLHNALKQHWEKNAVELDTNMMLCDQQLQEEIVVNTHLDF